jgi:hypothetical protein
MFEFVFVRSALFQFSVTCRGDRDRTLTRRDVVGNHQRCSGSSLFVGANVTSIVQLPVGVSEAGHRLL